jgi:bifunctional oligoribonuclease and PAP phosphatase NrnA
MEITERQLDLFRSHRKFVLTTHMSSDGDGIGSQLALARGLVKLGCDVAMINPTPVPENFHFLLDRSDEIVTPADMKDPRKAFANALTVVLDMGAFERLGAVLPLTRLSEGMVVVDHHRMEKVSGVQYILDTTACATGEVTARILDGLRVPFDLSIAQPLYVAVHTDTGGFRYPGTTPETHRLAARLLEAGVDPQKIYTEIFERQSPVRLRLTGEVLSTLSLSPGGKVAWLHIDRPMLDRAGAQWEDADDMVNFTLQVDGVLAGFYFKELDTGMTKVSCRSRGDFAIDQFVSKWGGGGHHHAAGVRLDAKLKEAMDLIIPAATAALEGGG